MHLCTFAVGKGEMPPVFFHKFGLHPLAPPARRTSPTRPSLPLTSPNLPFPPAAVPKATTERAKEPWHNVSMMTFTKAHVHNQMNEKPKNQTRTQKDERASEPSNEWTHEWQHKSRWMHERKCSFGPLVCPRCMSRPRNGESFFWKFANIRCKRISMCNCMRVCNCKNTWTCVSTCSVFECVLFVARRCSRQACRREFRTDFLMFMCLYLQSRICCSMPAGSQGFSCELPWKPRPKLPRQFLLFFY